MVLGALFLGGFCATQAQSTNNPSTDTTRHHYGMHRGWGNRPGGDSTAKRDGFRHGGQQGWAKRDGQGHGGAEGHGFREGGRHGRGGFPGWARNRNGRNGGIHYTPEQRKQVMAINKDYRQKSEDLFKQDNSTLKQYKAGLLALQKEKKDKLAALLTPQQKDQMAARKKRMDENRQVMEVARLERLKLHLNLNDDQIARIKAGQENLRSQFKAIHENDNLLPQQKMEQMKALMAKRNDTYRSVLTPEQYTQFEKMSHRHPGGPGGPGSRSGSI